MNWAGKQHPVETLAEWMAPALLAAAAGWAAWSASLPIAIIVPAATVAFATGFAAMRMAEGRNASTARPFEPVDLDHLNSTTEVDVLLLEPKDEVLILDDPLVELAPDSRVVRLFARHDPTPGELVDRIADFLGDGRRVGPEDLAPAPPVAPADASAALHAALANIRASLR